MKRFTHITGGYTLIEILAGILIVMIVTVGWFYAINTVGIGKVKLIEKTQLEQEAFFFSERLFEIIKQSGTLDYEEYFNRKVVGDTEYASGHYQKHTGFGNGSNTMIYCVSPNGTAMWRDGCITSNNTSWGDITGEALLYGQYAQQFIDYNSDADADWWNEDGDTEGNIIWDDDDKYLGDWPRALPANWKVQELYLINDTETKRVFFRRFVSVDPYAWDPNLCDFSTPNAPTWESCLGTIQFLKLTWVDWWNDHDIAAIDDTQNDGIIDTWIYDPQVYGLSTNVVADEDVSAPNSEPYWVPVFADGIHVKNLDMYVYPSKDSNLAWADSDLSTFVSPYLRVSMNLTPSWKNKRKIKWVIPEIQINTTINLSSNYN